MKTQQAHADAEMRQQSASVARVFCDDKSHGAKHFNRPKGNVAKVSNRRRNHVQGSAQRTLHLGRALFHADGTTDLTTARQGRSRHCMWHHLRRRETTPIALKFDAMERTVADEGMPTSSAQAPLPRVPPSDRMPSASEMPARDHTAPSDDLAASPAFSGGVPPLPVLPTLFDLSTSANRDMAKPVHHLSNECGVVAPDTPSTSGVPSVLIGHEAVSPDDLATGRSTGQLIATHASGSSDEVFSLSASHEPASVTTPTDDSLVPLAEMPGLMAPRVELAPSLFAYWRKSIILGAIVAALASLTLWEYSTIPKRPASPVITVATPAPNATPLDVGMSEALRRVRLALVAHDVVSLARMIDTDGLVVGPYSGGIPESGYPIPETKSFLSNVMTDARLATLGWRTDSRGRVFLLVDGWRTRPLSLSPNSTLELTPLAVMVMQSRNGAWAIRWFLIDATGILTQQARNMTWQAVP
jgi:hypothetical protein